MPATDNKSKFPELDRRNFLGGAAALGLSASISPISALAQASPKKGGTLRMGMEGGSPSDSLDPRSYADAIAISYSLMFWNQLTEIDSKGNVTPELAESWEFKPGAKEWVFNIRKGVPFTSGKMLDADDVIYSINLHRGETKSPAKQLMDQIKEIKKLSPTQLQITLGNGNADLPALFTDYHIIIVPNGTTDFSKPDGTGAYTLVEWQPGVRVVAKRKPGSYWKPSRGNFDMVELRYINEAAARTQALVTGQVDIINRLDPKTVSLLSKIKNLRISRTAGSGDRYCFVAHTDIAPYNNRDVMLGLKYGIDRKKIIDNVYSGFATLGNDHLVGPTNIYYDHKQMIRPYDPDKAKFHFKKAGYSGPFELHASDGAFSGSVDSAVVFQESLRIAGGSVEVKRMSGDGYWENVWPKVPFCSVPWYPRASVDMQLSSTFLAGGPWNDTKYNSPKFDKLLIDARVEASDAKRRAMYAEAQSMLSEEAGMICFAIGDFLDGCSTKLMGLETHGRYAMNDMRIAEKGWFA